MNTSIHPYILNSNPLTVMSQTHILGRSVSGSAKPLIPTNGNRGQSACPRQHETEGFFLSLLKARQVMPKKKKFSQPPRKVRKKAEESSSAPLSILATMSPLS